MKKLLHNSKIYKFGFTLAEVLITLVIIGVIAAMTIPTLINKTQNQEFVSKLKKTYSVFKSVTDQIINEEGLPRGDIGGWASSPENVYNLYIKHLSVSKACKNKRGCVDQLSSHGSGSTNGFMSLNNSHFYGNNCELDSDFYKFILSDGIQVIINDGSYPACDHSSSGSKNMCSAIFVDLNGEKGPNTWGKDVFFFAIKEDGLYPGGCDDLSVAQCHKTGYGTGCACKVIREGAINY